MTEEEKIKLKVKEFLPLLVDFTYKEIEDFCYALRDAAKISSKLATELLPR